ncbi:hypothetical protein ACROYT_G027273 [Oculina patagonica]
MHFFHMCENQIKGHCFHFLRWLDYLLSRVTYQAKAFVKNAFRDREKGIKRISKIIVRLYLIEKKEDAVMMDLLHFMKTHLESATKKLSEYLKSDEVRDRFTLWTLDEVPKVQGSWKETESKMIEAFTCRMTEIVEHWEEDNQVIANTRESLLQHFQQRYSFVEGELRNLQGAVTADDPNLPNSVPFDVSFTTAQKVVLGVTSPIWVPLTLAALVVSVPVIGVMAIKEKIEGNRMLKTYENDKCAFMTKASAAYLDTATGIAVLKPFMEDQLKDAVLCVKQIQARIPELIRADKMLCEQLVAETRSQEEIKELYQPIVEEASDIRGHLAVFGLKEIRAVDIKSEDLDWKEDISFCLGRGAFATVYQGKLKRHGMEQSVALKVCNDVFNVQNASFIMAEVELLRKLDHPHIVKFYGTSLLLKMDTVRMILVMEKCKGTLKSHIFDHPEAVPAKSRNPAVQREACRWAREITGALVFIHEKGVVHRDLKLDNILLSEGNSVRITDVGVSKEAKDITGTLAGTPVYIAPEVFHSEVYDSKADIYSFGLILWETWYGQQAFAEVKLETLAAFFSLVDDGYRPKDVEGCKKPPRHWKELMEQCWHKNPEERPSAQNCHQKTTELYKQVVLLV